jgi:hypothetical protein
LEQKGRRSELPLPLARPFDLNGCRALAESPAFLQLEDISA